MRPGKPPKQSGEATNLTEIALENHETTCFLPELFCHPETVSVRRTLDRCDLVAAVMASLPSLLSEPNG